MILLLLKLLKLEVLVCLCLNYLRTVLSFRNLGFAFSSFLQCWFLFAS
jgi:hypothetical protein